MGVSGACRGCELTNLKISDVEDRGAYLIVPITTIRSGTDNNYKLLINGNEVKYDKTKNEMSINVNVNVNINNK
jgi:hypothetical protein